MTDHRLSDLKQRIDAAFSRNGTTQDCRDTLLKRATMIVPERFYSQGMEYIERIDMNEFARRKAERLIP